MTSRWPVMTEPHRQQIDRYRCWDGHIGKRAGNFGMMGDMVHQYRNTGADGSGRGEDKVMREVPHKGAAQTVQHGMEAFAKIDPPHGEENDAAGAQGQPQPATPGVVLADGGDGSGEREQSFAKNDDRTQAVARDNMLERANV